MYEAMVKEAYENILGIEKEAGVGYEKFRKRLADKAALRRHEKSDLDALAVDQRNARTESRTDLKNKKSDDSASNFSAYAANVNARNNDIVKNYEGRMQNKNTAAEKKLARKNQARTDKASRFADMAGLINAMNDRDADNYARVLGLSNTMRSQRAENIAARRAIGHSYIADTAGTADLKAAQRAHRLELAEQRKAEKAAAFYEEAQLVKEAAENDYMEACAYEEAALTILNELGYFDED